MRELLGAAVVQVRLVVEVVERVRAAALARVNDHPPQRALELLRVGARLKVEGVAREVEGHLNTHTRPGRGVNGPRGPFGAQARNVRRGRLCVSERGRAQGQGGIRR